MTVFHWLAIGVDVLSAIGFVVAALLWGKRVGGAAPWLLAAVAVIDVGMFGLFSLFDAMHDASASFESYERSLSLLQLLDAASMFFCGALALVAFFLMMPKTAR